MANSATSVLPAPVGADTMTDDPAAMARQASTWKSSSGNGYLARNRSKASIGLTLPCDDSRADAVRAEARRAPRRALGS